MNNIHNLYTWTLNARITNADEDGDGDDGDS